MPSERDECGHRVFHAPQPWPARGEILVLSPAESRHARDVMRLHPCDTLELVDGRGKRARGEIVSGGRGNVKVRLRSIWDSPKESGPRIVLGLPNLRSRSRLDWAIEKGSELGVHEFHIFLADRSVKRSPRHPELRVERWSAIARAAMKQSGRAWLPDVKLAASLVELLSSVPATAIIAADESGEATLDARAAALLASSAPAALATRPATRTTQAQSADRSTRAKAARSDMLLLLVGPEGGFSTGERALLAERGASFLSLGWHRLRVETAAIALCARIAAQGALYAAEQQNRE